MSIARRRVEVSLGPDRGGGRFVTVAAVVPGGAGDGSALVWLDWDGDGGALVPAARDRDAPVPTAGDTVLVVMVGRDAFVVARVAGAPGEGSLPPGG